MFRRREGRGTDRSNETRFITNLTNKVITLGDIDNLELRPRQRVDLLKFASIQRIGSSVDLKRAVKAGWIKFQDRDRKVVKKANVEKAIIPAVLRDIRIGELTDVVISDLQDDDILKYNGSTWENIQPEDTEGADTEGADKNVTSVSTNYTILSIDDLILVDASSGDVTISLPSAVSNPGKEFDIKKIDSSENEVILDPYSTETIDTEDGQRIDYVGDCINIVSNSSNWYII